MQPNKPLVPTAEIAARFRFPRLGSAGALT